MPAEFFYVILLLAVAVIFGYFYLKRAQARTPDTKANEAVNNRMPAPPIQSATAIPQAAPVPPVTTATAATEMGGAEEMHPADEGEPTA